MEEMTQTEFYSYLELLADLIESKAKTVDEAVEIIRRKAEEVKPNQ